jgi:hypothetical protein
MKSQVSFTFDGIHNEDAIKLILRKNLKKMKCFIAKEGYNLYRCYVGADNTNEEVMDVCKGMQNFAVYDSTHTF